MAELEEGPQQINIQNDTTSNSTGSVIQQVEGAISPFESKLDQLEIKIVALNEKVSGSVEIRKWVLIAVISIVGIFLTAIATIFVNFNNSLSEYRQLEEQYYKHLIELYAKLPSIQNTPTNQTK